MAFFLVLPAQAGGLLAVAPASIAGPSAKAPIAATAITRASALLRMVPPVLRLGVSLTWASEINPERGGAAAQPSRAVAKRLPPLRGQPPAAFRHGPDCTSVGSASANRSHTVDCATSHF